MTFATRIARYLGIASCTFALAVGGALAQPAQAPIRIGSTLALTGPLAATSLVHKVVGEIYVEQLNQRGGLLGRKVEWIVKDDQSKPDLARTLYEQLITSDKVDLLMGPYATGAILSAMGVAQRYNKVLVHHTFGIPSMAKYDMQFPAWSLGPDPATTVPNTVFDALAASRPIAVNYGGWQADLLSESGAGLVLDPTDADEAGKLLADRLRDDDWLRRARAAAHRLAVERFSRDLLCDQFETVLTRAYAGGKSVGAA